MTEPNTPEDTYFGPPDHGNEENKEGGGDGVDGAGAEGQEGGGAHAQPQEYWESRRWHWETDACVCG